MGIVKTKFLCKRSSQIFSRFIEGKWYDGEYETWSEQLYKLNGGWRRYWVINEMGKKEEIPKAHMNAIFEKDIQNLRDSKINEILK